MKKYFLLIIGIILFVAEITSYADTLQNNFFGISGAELANVEQRLAVKQKTDLAKPNAANIRAFYNQAPQEIKKALEPYGYFKARVTSRLTRQGDVSTATYYIRLGSPLKITSLDIKITGSGAKNPIFQKFLKQNPLKVGQTLQTEQYQDFKQKFLDLAINNGYLFAKIKAKEIRIDLKKYTAQITLHFATGPRYRFGLVEFAPSPFADSFLKRFVPFQAGDFYSNKKILELHENLSSSNLFQRVTVRPKIKKAKKAKNLTLPVEVKLVPRKARQYTLGIGYGTDTGIRGLAGIEFRHLTATGHTLNAEVRASQIETDFETHYLIPGKNPVTDKYDLSAAIQAQYPNYGNAQAYKVSAGYITDVFTDWQQTLRLTAQKERYNLKDQPKQNSFFLTPSINLLRVKANNPIRPKRGSRINIMLQGAAKDLLSDTSFLQAKIDAKYLHPLSSVNLIVLRATIGYTAISNLNDLPLTYKSFAGGAQSVRGYSYNGLGPGQSLLTLSAELRQKVYKDWYLAAFFDAGNADRSFHMKLKRGIGLGIVWLSPLGVMELSYAKAVDNKGTPGMVQFSMGPEF